MKLILAPMDGLTDTYARELLTGIGGYDLCVTEFLRVTDTLFPARVFYRRFPELRAELKTAQNKISHTKSGTPVFLQLLGSDNTAMAENAAKAVQLGAKGIDLNFGCPAKTVNRRGGGASLLNHPEQINQLVHSVRQVVPDDIPVTAKMRLGYDDQALSHDNALAIQDGGADWLTIHARTKKDGYRPPAYWDALAPISALLDIPVIANGEVWSVEDYFACREQSGCDSIMLGRGAMVTPDLALQIKSALVQKSIEPIDWPSICLLLEKLYQLMIDNPELNEKYIAPRLKLWVKWLMIN
ncbi:MAG: tRNA-dihydrouridine synthase family protein [gamma proteobacterium symbiont of Lucinoma myriamae]|nr:tRNA-dihydrouridine synthase family protein [gamma proteobacterium symbiont of Lucinoma myriamae]MCU7819507.1 tRNA-dihydrouridine synthase family protein [gamma proteobacterium symbiont of Lucinoma myriamae]MCU7833261.1 tRNA-dihydrouridine synthase family protein [gamma proteobacterium symbiont of Lucinoma myriamae]